jgi:hypothetical protein
MSFIGKIVFFINTQIHIIINRRAIIFVTIIDQSSLFKKLYSGEFLFFTFSRTLEKLSVGIISSIYFGVNQLLIK